VQKGRGFSRSRCARKQRQPLISRDQRHRFASDADVVHPRELVVRHQRACRLTAHHVGASRAQERTRPESARRADADVTGGGIGDVTQHTRREQGDALILEQHRGPSCVVAGEFRQLRRSDAGRRVDSVAERDANPGDFLKHGASARIRGVLEAAGTRLPAQPPFEHRASPHQRSDRRRYDDAGDREEPDDTPRESTARSHSPASYAGSRWCSLYQVRTSA
jgi:hypothetical protein